MAVDDSYTKALLHFNGADTSTTFTDESGKTWTAAGNAQIDTAQSVFGGASGLFDGTGDYIHTPDHADFDFGTGDFTIDFRVRFAGWHASNYDPLYSQWADANNRIFLAHISASNLLQLYVVSASTVAVNFSKAWTPSLDTWYHVAVVRTGNDFKMFIDGTQIGTTVTDTDAMPNIGGTVRLGYEQSINCNLNGWLDEYRVSKGIARWTGDFTPPTAEYGVTFVPHTIIY